MKEILNKAISITERQIARLKEEVESLKGIQSRIELDPDDYAKEFEESFNEEIVILGIRFDTSKILKEMDRTAYDTYLNDYVDSEYTTEGTSEYVEAQEQIDKIENEICDLEIELESLNDKLEFLDEEVM